MTDHQFAFFMSFTSGSCSLLQDMSSCLSGHNIVQNMCFWYQWMTLLLLFPIQSPLLLVLAGWNWATHLGIHGTAVLWLEHLSGIWSRYIYGTLSCTCGSTMAEENWVHICPQKTPRRGSRVCIWRCSRHFSCRIWGISLWRSWLLQPWSCRVFNFRKYHPDHKIQLITALHSPMRWIWHPNCSLCQEYYYTWLHICVISNCNIWVAMIPHLCHTRL